MTLLKAETRIVRTQRHRQGQSKTQKEDLKVSEHTYLLVEDRYYKYWIIPDFASGRKNRHTVVVITASGFVCIGRELTLGSAKETVERDVFTKAKNRYNKELYYLKSCQLKEGR